MIICRSKNVAIIEARTSEVCEEEVQGRTETRAFGGYVRGKHNRRRATNDDGKETETDGVIKKEK